MNMRARAARARAPRTPKIPPALHRYYLCIIVITLGLLMCILNLVLNLVVPTGEVGRQVDGTHHGHGRKPMNSNSCRSTKFISHLQ
jgi:hypothetical protein